MATFLVLFTIFVIGLFWLGTNPSQTVTLTLSYAAGLSMIVLPCTLPLVFVIVPLSMGERYRKGLSMAILFSLGLIITLSLYGVAVAVAGQAFALPTVIQALYLIAGTLAWIFGLSELKLIRFTLPSYGKIPGFVQKRRDYSKALLLGLFLGNAGLGCPNPATYVILTHIAGVGNILQGILLQFVNGLGRAVPLVALSILGILGVNAVGGIVKRRKTINKATGWGLVGIGAIILVWGAFGHYWFLNTPLHSAWDNLFASFGGGVAEYECCVEPPCVMCARGQWIFDEGRCECRMELEIGNLDRVCPECKVGLAEGEGIKQIAERTQIPAFSVLAALIAIPIGLYYWKKPFEKEV